MKRLILSLTLLFFIEFIVGQTNSKHVYVKPYTKSDGTYVPGHNRTAPNSTNRDNFSTKGNTNPYTGQPGWVDPDSKGTYTTSTYPSSETNYNTSYPNSPNTKSGSCTQSGCSNAARLRTSSDYGYSESWTSYTNFCSAHTPKCENPSCSNYKDLYYSGYSKYCSNHAHTCSFNGCYNQARLKTTNDYGYTDSWVSYSTHCSLHTPKCENPSCNNFKSINYSGYDRFCAGHLHTCSFSGCYNQARQKNSGDYGYTDSWISYTSHCPTHTPKCENPSCNNYKSLYYSGYSKFCSDHAHTCSAVGCYNQAKQKTSGDYGYSYSYTSFTSYCATHSKKCNYPNCTKIAMLYYDGYQSYCVDHK